MAINQQADIRCSDSWYHLGGIYPDAVGFVLEAAYEGDEWRPRCGSCIERFRKDPDITYDVAYLDPTRQRRPNPDQPADDNPCPGPNHHHTAACFWPLNPYDTA